MNLVFVHHFVEFITHNVRLSFLENLIVLLLSISYSFKWHLYDTLNEQPFTRALKLTTLNFRQILRKKYLLKFIFSEDVSMINPLIHGGKKVTHI